MASRLALYVRRLYRIAAALALIVLALYGLQIWLHPFDAILAKLSDFAMNVDQRISQEAFKGITIGTLGLVLALCVHGEKHGTISSSVLAIPERFPASARYLYAGGPPCRTPYEDVSSLFASASSR